MTLLAVRSQLKERTSVEVKMSEKEDTRKAKILGLVVLGILILGTYFFGHHCLVELTPYQNESQRQTERP